MRALVITLAAACGSCGSFSAAEVDGGAPEGGVLRDGVLNGDQVGVSCAALRAQGATQSGYYALSPGADSTLDAYCDMDTDGGGWTLVARSAADSRSFGWLNPTGDVRDDAQAYALNVSRLAAFTEILFGARGEGKAWASPVYARVLPAGFLGSYGSRFTSPLPSRGLLGCTSLQQGAPSMLSLMGQLKTRDHFVFTDSEATPDFGLTPTRWETNGDQAPPRCDYDGLLTGKPGMIFVR